MTTVTSTAATETPSTNLSIGKLNADFDMFLKLLTAQMQNQDPLDPMDTSEYTQQLVQYSQVEQAIEQTETLKSMLAGMSAQSLTQATSMIGREAEVASSEAGLTADAPATWSWSASRPPATLIATIRDARGNVVESRTLDPAGGNRFTWDGARSTGGHAPDGVYTLDLEALDASGAAIGTSIASVGTVGEVRFDAGAVTLLINGASQPLSKLLSVRS